ncbi:MAG: beta-galactosidase [Armatimonadota bacterium]|nr:MAG: beta-galactosidase [Armatimonadota bacterium]
MTPRDIILLALFAGVAAAALPAPASSAPQDEFIRVAPDRWTFETAQSRQRFIPWGTNFVLHDRKYLDMFGPQVYDRALYDRALSRMENLNINLVKVFLPIAKVLPDPQGPREARLAPGYLDNVDDFLELARQHQIRVVLSLAEWGGNEIKWWHEGGEYFGRSPWKSDGVDSLVVLESFWTQVATRLRDNPTLFSYEPCVEWTLPSYNLTWRPPDEPWGPVVTEPAMWYWRRWAVARHGSLDALNRAWGTTFTSVDEIGVCDYAYDFGAHRYVDPAAKIMDYQDFREWASYRYFKPQIEAIRRADPNHMVAIANHMRPPGSLWEGAAQYFSGLSEPEQSDLVDYMTHHDNHDASEVKGSDYAALVRGVTVRLRACLAGRPMPVILEEFSLDSQDPEQVAGACSDMVRATVGSCSGWMVWYFQHWDDGNPTGLVDGEMQPTAWGRAFSRLGGPSGLVHSSDLSWHESKQVIALDREAELVPTRMGMIGQVLAEWDNYEHPVGFRWPRNPFIALPLEP